MAKAGNGVTAIIPARVASTRFPGKALAADTGTPMVVHVCEQAAKARRVDRVVVATDASEIAEAVRGRGFEAVMTGEHDNGTSRITEAARALDLDPATTVINVQGDEPEIEPEIIDAAADALRHNTLGFPVSVGTVVSPFEPAGDPSDPNLVKAAMDAIEPDTGIGHAVYFSRAPIPYARDPGEPVTRYRHVGIYAYAAGTLAKLAPRRSSALERAEKLEQLAWLAAGHRIAAAVRHSAHHGIDTPEQYAAFVERRKGSRPSG